MVIRLHGDVETIFKQARLQSRSNDGAVFAGQALATKG